MKKLFFFFSALLLVTSCTQKIYMSSYVFDLAEYYKQGVFVTESNSVSFDYEPIGLVQTVGGGSNYVKAKVVTLSAKEVMDKFVQECKDRGANAVINVRILTIVQSNIPKYQISGMAIKRK